MKYKILNTKEKCIIDGKLLEGYDKTFTKCISWRDIFALLKWLEGKATVEYVPYKNIIIKGN